MVDLGVENERLLAKIKALRTELGPSAIKQMEKAKKVFQAFDANGDGRIDLEEFRQMAHECGARTNCITDERVTTVYQELTKSNTEPLSFPAFRRWLLTASSASYLSDLSPEVLKLKLKLKSRSFLRGLSQLRSEAVKADKKRGGQARAATGRHKPDQNGRGVDIGINIGEFKEAGSGIYVRMGVEKETAKATLKALGCGNDARCLLYGDIVLKKDTGEADAKKTLGSIKELVQKAPLEDLTGPLKMNAHAKRHVFLSTREIKGEARKVIRIGLSSSMDPIEAVSGSGKASNAEIAMLGALQQQRDRALLSGEMKLEFPFSLKAVADSKVLDLKKLRSRFSMKASLSSELISISRNLLDKYGRKSELLKSTAASFHASLVGLGFFRSAKLHLKFASPSEFLDWIPDKANPKLDEAKASVTRAMSTMLENPVEFARSVISSKGLGLLEMLPLTMKNAYESCREFSTGLDGAKFHLQFDDFVVVLDILGLDLTLLAPKLAPSS